LTPTNTKSLPLLSDDYYLRNFNTLINFVHHHYENLLNSDEQRLFSQYHNLPENCQRLYIRLVSRNSAYIRCSKLNYPEIGNMAVALDTLCDQGFLSQTDESTLAEWLPLFSKPEVSAVLPVAGVAKPPVSNIEAALFSHADLFGSRPIDLLLENNYIVQVQHKALVQTYRLLFFGNLHQDFTSFVLRDLGLRKFESDVIDSTLLPFKSRAQIDACLVYYQCADLYDTVESEGHLALTDLYQQLPETTCGDPTLIRRVEKLAAKIARQLERLGALTDAASIYRQIASPPARERLARIMDKLGNSTEAFSLCQTIKADPASAEEEEFAQQFSVRLAKKLKIDYPVTTPLEPPEIHLSLPRTSLPVEFTAALHFAKNGKCFYVENSLITGILGLAIWDIIFKPLPGAFYHPFQTAPSDFFEPAFYTRRKALLDRRLQQIKDGKLATLVLTHYHQKKGVGNPLVHWHNIDRYLLTLALKRVPVNHWLMLMEHLLRDIRNHRSGLPDLLYFPDAGGYQLLEVKGPGDRLQKNQLRWMRQFDKCGMDYAVVHVDYPPDGNMD